MAKKAKFFEFILFCYLMTLCLVPLPAMYFSIFSTLTMFAILPFVLVARKNDAAVPIFRWFVFILLWALITTTFHDYFLDMSYILLPLFFAFLNILVPFLFSKLAANEVLDVRKHIHNFSKTITICIVLYALKTYAAAPGLVRLASPVGGSAVIHVALLLTCSVYLANLKIGSKKVSSTLFMIITLAMIILTGSRAGLLTIGLLLLSAIISKSKPARSIGLSLLIASIGYVLFQLLPTDRFTTADSPLRSLSYQNSINIATSSASHFVFGAGYGAVWPWYGYVQNILVKTDELVLTDFGLLLTHPHSLFLGLFSELGMIGLMPFLIICWIIFKHLFASLRNKDPFNTTILYGVICTLPAFMLDYYLFFNNTLSAIWWYFVFFAVTVNSVKGRENSPLLNSYSPSKE